MKITLRFFARIRETIGTPGETLEVPSEVQTIGDLRKYLQHRGGVWNAALAETQALRMACDQNMADESTPLHPGCEVAFFPPVTGG